MRQKDIIELGVTGILVIVLIVAFGNAAKKAHGRIVKNTSEAVNLNSVAPNQVEKIDSRSLYKVLEDEAKSMELKRDPFTTAPIISEKNMQSGFALTGILWDKVKPMAIIDGDVVKKGGRVGNKVVVDIKKDRVILSDGQDLFEVRLER